MRRRLWRVPSDDGGILIDPPLGEIEAALQQNRDQFETSDVIICGRPLIQLRADLRDEVSAAARSLYAPLLEQSSPSLSAPWIVTGHQPELFHPGVWLKNFAADGIARRIRGVPVHLIVDTDTVKHESFRVPIVSADPTRVRNEVISFDRAAGENSIEAWRCRDEALFDSAPTAISRLHGSWGFRPLLDQYWSEAQRFRGASPADERLGLRFSFARRRFEAAWGCESLDVLQSVMCRTRTFAQILAGLFCEHRRFHDVYNHNLNAYRLHYRVRSRNHPAPDLKRDGDWFEMPFWVNRQAGTSRGRLFVRNRASEIELRAGQHGSTVTADCAPDSLARLIDCHDWQIRTRALTTTLFARMFLADLFIHGIGGAKYDEVTDGIIADFFRVTPPTYAVVTGTLHLPLPAFPAIRANHDQLWRWLRDLDWNPERYVELPDANTQLLISQKQALIASQAHQPAARKERFRSLQRLTADLRHLVAEKRAKIEQVLQHCDVELAANEILRRRDYAFVLYPEEKLRPFCTRVLELTR